MYYIDPLGRPVVTFTHVFKILSCKYHVIIIIASGGTVGLTDRIIDGISLEVVPLSTQCVLLLFAAVKETKGHN